MPRPRRVSPALEAYLVELYLGRDTRSAVAAEPRAPDAIAAGGRWARLVARLRAWRRRTRVD
jgi:hypothetical protein